MPAEAGRPPDIHGVYPTVRWGGKCVASLCLLAVLVLQVIFQSGVIIFHRFRLVLQLENLTLRLFYSP